MNLKYIFLPGLILIAFGALSQNKKDTMPRGPGYYAQQSRVLKGLEWIGEEIPYKDPGGDEKKKGDTYPLTWAGNDTIYTSAGDPLWGKPDGLDVESIAGGPAGYLISKVNNMEGYTGWGGCGPKPAGMISINNVLYMTFQNMTGPRLKFDGKLAEFTHGYDASVIYSKDLGKTWHPDIRVEKTPFFPGRIFGSPAIINYGKDNADAVDNYVYTVSGEGWCNGNNLRLARVHKDKIMDRSAWEWVSGFGKNFKPVWTDNMWDATPVLTHENYLGYIDMVYIEKLKRYLLLGWRFKEYSNPNLGTEIIMYESPKPWGPFSVVYKDEWETPELTPYNPRLPLKWFDQEKLEGWILFSGTWRNGGQTPHYRAHVRKFRLISSE